MKRIDAYKKILKVIESCAKEVKLDITYRLHNLIIREELQERFGINLQNYSSYSDTYFKLGDDVFIAKYGDKYNRTISWSDDGSQPEDEWLFVVCYPTGAFIFGEDYQQDTFKKYFEELKSYNPKYVDTVNKCLYYTEDVAKDVFENVNRLFIKYKAIAEDSRKASKIEALKKQLEELEK